MTLLNEFGNQLPPSDVTIRSRRRIGALKPWAKRIWGLVVSLVLGFGGWAAYASGLFNNVSSIYGQLFKSDETAASTSPMSEDEIIELVTEPQPPNDPGVQGKPSLAKSHVDPGPAPPQPAKSVIPPVQVDPPGSGTVATAPRKNAATANNGLADQNRSAAKSASAEASSFAKTDPKVPKSAASNVHVLSDPGASGPVEVTSIVFQEKERLVDVRVRNITDQPVIIHQILLDFRYVVKTSFLVPSGTHDLGITSKDVRRARERGEPLSFRRGFNVAYTVAPRGTDRYLFKLSVSPDELHNPDARGEYILEVYLKADRHARIKDSFGVRIRGKKLLFRANAAH
jgi:hypothetical protein